MKTMHIAGRSIQIVSHFKNLEELAEQLKTFSYRVLKEDCLDLPEKIYMKREIELSPEQKKVYKQMKEEALATLNGKQITTMTVLTQLMRLQQITCGHFCSGMMAQLKKIKSNRLSELMDILDEVEGKAIIWAHWQKDIQIIKAALIKKYGPWSVVDYYGLTPQDQRQANIKKFSGRP